MAIALTFLLASFLTASSLLVSGQFQDFDITWGDGRAKILDDADTLTLSLDAYSGSGIQSKHSYLFGKFDMQLKLVPGNSAGTLSSDGPYHDEIDFEFLGNLSGDPYTVHTNIYTQGKGEREQQFRLWFDPTADFHTYSILWTQETIVLSVDEMPVREFKNMERRGVPFPKEQAMRVYSSIWNGDEWATRGGQVKTDWSRAPFTAAYRGYKAEEGWREEMLDQYSEDKLRWVKENYMIYNYCSDGNRFPQGLPQECHA
ncbi:hypothetical protein SASPL_108959 [Salvia splendens]|uniref:Xyloglucan endotransglucosylase/hydrolase n=1 Tax=Salvia splendens TaxID=180675 RepID=A0A8X9A7Y3_SALSN|nr:hypothetical protein SASPL_108959 [Salvia splendens]